VTTTDEVSSRIGRAPVLAARTCARRLAAFGVGEDAVDCDISWFGPARLAPTRAGSEAVVQALSGLMAVHGRDEHRPVRLGLEAGSVAAGMLAAQGVLAAEIGRARGRSVRQVETSVLQSTFMLLSHYLAAATAVGDVIPPTGGTAPGPPFPTSDGYWFEIEVFDAEAWKAFWSRLGAPPEELGRAWTAFRARYYRGTCQLSPGLHAASRGHCVADVAAAAEACGVSLCRVRAYDEVLADPGPFAGDPSLAVDAPVAGDDASLRSEGRSGPGTPHRAAPGTPTVAGTDLPLEGIRVVEATSRMQGPLAGLLCQMLGAEVVRVEPPGGDVGRMVPPFAGDTGSFFLCFNRGKRTVEVDLGRPAGRRELADLIGDADVFLHNWRPGKAGEWGLDAGDLSPRNPGLVYVQASGWGGRDEDRRLIGTDFLVQAFTGAGNGLRPEGEAPVPTRVLLADFMGALVTCEGMLGGLYQRQQRGRGGRVGTSLLQGAMALQAHVFDGLASGPERPSERGPGPERAAGGAAKRREGRPVWGPLDPPIECPDGALVVTADDDDAVRRLCQVCDMAADDGPPAVVEARLAERLAAGPATKWEELLVDAGVPCAVASTDLSALPTDARFSSLFEPLSETCLAPRSPWTILP
jgi:crotonobetainyl-CoA:carnitine CoA-transferase CaiB-like acyl-CoA transferase